MDFTTHVTKKLRRVARNYSAPLMRRQCTAFAILSPDLPKKFWKFAKFLQGQPAPCRLPLVSKQTYFTKAKKITRLSKEFAYPKSSIVAKKITDKACQIMILWNCARLDSFELNTCESSTRNSNDPLLLQVPVCRRGGQGMSRDRMQPNQVTLFGIWWLSLAEIVDPGCC